jgi:hypothetical protein
VETERELHHVDTGFIFFNDAITRASNGCSSASAWPRAVHWDKMFEGKEAEVD